MIEVKEGSVHIQGEMPTIRAELTTLIHSMYETVLIKGHGMSPEQAKKLILETVENGFLTKEQLANKVVNRFSDDFIKWLAETLKGNGDN